MSLFISGAISMACAVVGLYFLRFWRDTHDRLFGMFALAFLVFGVSRVILALTTQTSEAPIFIYILRLIAFILILGAIVDKNLSRPAAVEMSPGPRKG